jgi:hypothetical protein
MGLFRHKLGTAIHRSNRRATRSLSGTKRSTIFALLNSLWIDDGGALLSVESLLVGTVLVIGLGLGLVVVRNALASELTELARGIAALNQSYSFGGLSGCCASAGGSQAIDGPAGPIVRPSCSPVLGSNINVVPCGPPPPPPPPPDDDFWIFLLVGGSPLRPVRSQGAPAPVRLVGWD